MLNVESGYNDGIVSPLFLFALILVGTNSVTRTPAQALGTAVPFALKALVAGIVASFVCGIAFRYIRQAPVRRRGASAPHASDFQLIEDTNSMMTMCMWFVFGNAVVLAVGEGIDWPTIVFGLLAFNALPDGQYADTALYAMTLTVLGSVLLHGGGSVVIARSLTGPPPSDSRIVAMQG